MSTKVSRTVWRRGKDGDNIKVLPIPINRISLCMFGGLATFFIFGGIMNPASVLMFQANPKWSMVLASYLAGIPFDLIHAVATVFFMWVMGPAMLEKLDRIKVKYGLIE